MVIVFRLDPLLPTEIVVNIHDDQGLSSQSVFNLAVISVDDDPSVVMNEDLYLEEDFTDHWPF